MWLNPFDSSSSHTGLERPSDIEFDTGQNRGSGQEFNITPSLAKFFRSIATFSPKSVTYIWFFFLFYYAILSIWNWNYGGEKYPKYNILSL